MSKNLYQIDVRDEAERPDISVVICAHTEQRWDDLLQAVQSVQDQITPAREIVVVVDHNPALLQRVQEHLTDVIVVANTQVQGLGGARNSGVATSQGDIVAFLDDDATAVPDWTSQLLAAYKDANVLGVGGAIEPADSRNWPRWFPDEFRWVVGCTYRGMPMEPTAVRNVHGCNMSFRRTTLEAVGGFRLGYGCDETEFCIRLAQHYPQAVVLYKPAARVYHRVPLNRLRWQYFRTRCTFEGGSKAVITHLWGTTSGLESERAYTLRTLPEGVLRGLADVVRRGDTSGAQRAGAIIAGLAFTAGGYLQARRSADEAARARGWTGNLERQTQA